MGGGGGTSSTTGVSDVLASVEREERNVRLKREGSVIGTSVEGRKTSSSSSGKNDSKGEEATFAQEAGRKPGRSARSSGSKSSSRDVSTLKGLVNSVGAAGTSNAGGRASFVGFSVLLERAGAFFAVLFCVFLVAVVGEGRSLAEKSERLPLPLGGVGVEHSIKVLKLAVCAVPVCTGAERSVKVLVLAVCAVPVCTGVCASVRVAARAVRPALVGDEGGSVVSVAGG